MEIATAQDRLARVSNIIPNLSSSLAIGDDDTAHLLECCISLLQSILTNVQADTIDYR